VLEQLLMDRACLLPKMSPAATFWWAERLAASIAKTPAWMEGFAKRMDIQAGYASEFLSWLSAGQILAEWPERFEEFLVVFQQVAKHRTTSTGISRRFGLLLREAAHLEQIGYPAPANALRDYLLRHYAAGHVSGKVCLFQGPENAPSLAARPWISQTAAARLLGVRSGAIAPLVTRGVLIGQIHPAGQHGRSIGLVSRQSVESLRLQLRSALDAGTTARQLGIGRHAVLGLIRADLLPRAVRTTKGWQVPLQSVAVWEAFCAELPRIKDESTDWISLRQATRVAGPSGLAMSQLLGLIQAGSLKARMADHKRGLNGIVVSRSDLLSAQKATRNQSYPSIDWSLQRAAENLFPARPMKPYVLKRWIREGLLRGYKENRRTMIPAEEIKRFRAEYCLAQEAMQILGLSRSTLSRWEAQGRIMPVYGKRVTSRAGFSLYRREDLRRMVAATS
jgi:DNA-binding XRE family transcriptional regulator